MVYVKINVCVCACMCKHIYTCVRAGVRTRTRTHARRKKILAHYVFIMGVLSEFVIIRAAVIHVRQACQYSID